MTTDDDLDAALAEALSTLVSALGTAQLERTKVGHLRLRDGDLVIDFHSAAHLNEIQPAVAIATPSGLERLSLDAVQGWLEEPVHAYMFNEANLQAGCRRAAHFAEKVIDRFRRDPASARNAIRAIERRRIDRFQINEIRQDANEAWARQDFALARALYEKVGDDLTPVERKRLDIAKRKPA